MLLICGHVSSSDVRVVPDIRIAEIREVRNLRPLADACVLELDERSSLRPGLENGAGSEVAERPDVHLRADDRVDDDGVRPDLSAGGDSARAPNDGERMDPDAHRPP